MFSRQEIEEISLCELEGQAGAHAARMIGLVYDIQADLAVCLKLRDWFELGLLNNSPAAKEALNLINEWSLEIIRSNNEACVYLEFIRK